MCVLFILILKYKLPQIFISCLFVAVKKHIFFYLIPLNIYICNKKCNLTNCINHLENDFLKD